MLNLLKFLRSPGLALGVLLFLALYVGVATWLSPWSSGKPIPPWMVALGLAHPFSSTLFLLICGLLFVNTLACTWDRTLRLKTLWQGTVPPGSPLLRGASREKQGTFLRAEGFLERGGSRFHNRWALWGGWILHLGLLVLMAGALVQQGFHEGGSFVLAEGETLDLSAPGAVRDRVAGPLAPAHPPWLTVGLLAYDASLHQKGYSPDRASKVRLAPREGTPVDAFVDRAEGLTIDGATIYQAIPAGLALVVEARGLGTRAIHLHGEGNTASAEVTDPNGNHLLFRLAAERDLSDRMGTGRLALRAERGGEAWALEPGRTFPFGRERAKLVSVVRWGAFTYARSPGMPAVFAGFTLLLAGSAILTVPAGVARFDEDAGAYRVHVTRGSEVLLAEWKAVPGDDLPAEG